MRICKNICKCSFLAVTHNFVPFLHIRKLQCVLCFEDSMVYTKFFFTLLILQIFCLQKFKDQPFITTSAQFVREFTWFLGFTLLLSEKTVLPVKSPNKKSVILTSFVHLFFRLFTCLFESQCYIQRRQSMILVDRSID